MKISKGFVSTVAAGVIAGLIVTMVSRRFSNEQQKKGMLA